MKRYGQDIAKRLLALAVNCHRAIGTFPSDKHGRHVGDQLFRALTSGGANYEEARGAESRADFVHKIRVAIKELRETHYWLTFAELAGWFDDRGRLIGESDELIRILTASANTTAKTERRR